MGETLSGGTTPTESIKSTPDTPPVKETTRASANPGADQPHTTEEAESHEPTGSQATGPASQLNDNTPLREEVTLIVDAIHCGACMIAIEDTLHRMPGVEKARVNLTTKRVRTTFDVAHVTLDDILQALKKIGYPAAELIEGAEAQRTAADQDLMRRVAVAGFASANIMLLSVSVWSGAGADMSDSIQKLFHWLSAVIALPAVAYAGQPFFTSAIRTLRAGRLNMDVPISLGVLLATAMSLYQTMRGTEQVYFDAAVMLLFFLLIGRFLDSRMRTRAAGAAANLLGLKAGMATLIKPDGTNARTSSRKLKPGDRFLVAAGEKIAADGTIETGLSEVEESLITGETIPRPIQPGDTVFAGTINANGSIVVTATATDDNTLLSEISRLMEGAEQSRSKYVVLADRAARIYAPAVHLLGLATFIGWMIAGAHWEFALTTAIAVLIITCPCALALAVPAVQVAAASRLFDSGLIVKSGDGLERLSEIDTVVFDKTGTLSLGEPELLNPNAISDETLTAASRLAANSRHPYSRAVIKAARHRGIETTPHTDIIETPGQGLSRSTTDGEERLGAAHFVCPDNSTDQAATLWYGAPGQPPTPFQFADKLRSDAAETVAQLTKNGYRIELLSGDREAAVARAAEDSGIAIWHAQRSPAEKIAHIEALRDGGHHVLMVGDGLNDAPALAAGHASISPASAADISQTTADAVFQGTALSPLLRALSVSRDAQNMAVQNFKIALGYNVVFVPLAVAGYVTPLIAAVAMSASSIAVTANAIRLRSKKFRVPRARPTAHTST